MTKLEIERRWLIRLPLSKEARQAIETDPDVPARITQTYLKSDDGAVNRVRFVEYDVWGVKQPGHYIATTKRFIEHGVNEENEYPLSESEYRARLLEQDTDTISIEKTRYHLHHKGHVFELDCFDGPWDGLTILELELKSMDEVFELPPYLTIDREITKETGWSNYHLAHRYTKPQGVWWAQTSSAISEGCDAVDLDSYMQPKGWFKRLMDWFRPETPSYDGRNERVYGEQIDEEID